jgi:hypothetical protein
VSKRSWLCAWVACAGCTGALATPAGPTSEPPTGADGVNGPHARCRAAPLPARILSSSQYRNTVADLLGVTPDIVVPPEGFAGPVLEEHAVDDLAAERLAIAAEKTAAAAVAAGSLHLCGWDAASDCTSSELVRSLGERAYRRPLSDAEERALMAVYEAGLGEGSEDVAREWLLGALLQAPDFLYRLAAEAPEEQRLSDSELASRLSYFLWDSMPDRRLHEAAAAGRLSDAGERLAEVERMLAHPKATRAVEAFYRAWLDLSRFRELSRDDPDFTSEVIASLEKSLLAGLFELYAQPSPDVSDLLSGSTYYLDDVLASFYGQPAVGEGFRPVDLSSEGRHGIVNHPALLSIAARPGESDPIGRGVFMLRNLFCRELTPPETLEIPPLPPVEEGVSVRERLAQHTALEACRSCHALIDPLGLSLESFDEVGRFRSEVDGEPVDSSGEIALGSDLDGTFGVGSQLFARLGESDDVRACFAQKFFVYGVAREATAEDACALEQIQAQFVASGDLRQLIVDIVESDAFLRRGEEEE